MLNRALEVTVARPLDSILPCRRALREERKVLEGLRAEHRDLARRATRRASRVREALSAATIIVTVEEIERGFDMDQADDARGRDRP